MIDTRFNFPASDPDRFAAALRCFDEENARDPNLEIADGVSHPRELLYARRLTDWVLRLCPNAEEPLRLAARCQHLCRWIIPRASYDLTRAGYLKWRTDLKKFHAEKASVILRKVGYGDDVIAQVQALNLKQNFPADPDSRVLEDALCLIFLEFQFAELAAKTTEDKMINVLKKSWQKMTPQAHEQALLLPFGPLEQALIKQALA